MEQRMAAHRERITPMLACDLALQKLGWGRYAVPIYIEDDTKSPLKYLFGRNIPIGQYTSVDWYGKIWFVVRKAKWTMLVFRHDNGLWRCYSQNRVYGGQKGMLLCWPELETALMLEGTQSV